MAVPKRRTSRSNTRHRRSQWRATAPDLVPVTIEGVLHRVPRRLVGAVMDGLVDPRTGRPTRRRGR
ncbi:MULTISPECIES: 50S ribosomal protein L32 [unclassified Nocardioides]|uniref:50S ribosomal protein L32 n=1 Tax=unclassified Nocardioides TaxID=2615069 RepID=UPI0006FEC053|nr:MULTISPECIES: 50S ribosomal protein L32 [unclassified Nocardioides]KRA29887.1 50S ribosomal protein L32 [Nocardioides sp. Root614]KRA86808.1 50S ribosomal protein L32 [Nocardioides sp. Root682]